MGSLEDVILPLSMLKLLLSASTRTGRFHERRHWDCTIVISYSGTGMYLHPPGEEVPVDIHINDLREEVEMSVGALINANLKCSYVLQSAASNSLL